MEKSWIGVWRRVQAAGGWDPGVLANICDDCKKNKSEECSALGGRSSAVSRCPTGRHWTWWKPVFGNKIDNPGDGRELGIRVWNINLTGSITKPPVDAGEVLLRNGFTARQNKEGEESESRYLNYHLNLSEISTMCMGSRSAGNEKFLGKIRIGKRLEC